MKKILISVVKLYQKTPLPTHSMCRHYPSCSNYMVECLENYGSIKGTVMGIKRIVKCNPLGTYGYDPVPHKGDK